MIVILIIARHTIFVIGKISNPSKQLAALTEENNKSVKYSRLI